MKKRSKDEKEHPQDNSLPVYGEDSDGMKKRGFDCILIDGEPYIETVNRNGRKVKTPISAAVEAIQKLKESTIELN